MDYMYAQVGQGNAVQDYPPFRPCLRLVGIDEPAFMSQAFNGTLGCRTHFIDIAWSYFYTLLASGAMHEPFPFGCAAWTRFPASLLDEWPDQLWIRIVYNRASTATGAYYYEIFANEDQINIAIESLRFQVGAAVTPPPLAPTGPSASRSQSFKLSAFHVGQGMCALLYGQRDGFLLDCGGGIPLKRSIYRQWLKAPASLSFRNDLRTRTKGLSLQAIISHPDSDHWRLLDWDPALFAATTDIFTPVGTAALALKSSRAIAKVSSLAGSTVVTNGPRGTTLLKAHRSNPAVSDRNGECLVVETHSGRSGKEISLFPGDYVYDRMASDGGAGIVALSSSILDAVMVPHHGDAASAAVSVLPKVPGTTAAFFSAGTHTGYRHPTRASLNAHSATGFRNIDKHTCSDIVECPLP